MPSNITRDGQYGIYDVELSRRIAAAYRTWETLAPTTTNLVPPMVMPFAAVDEIRQGELIQFRDEFVSGFGERTTEEEIDYFKNHTLYKAGKPEADDDFDHLRRRTWGISISAVAAPDGDRFSSGIAIVNGPACLECVLGTATASAVGNFIVPWTDKEKGGKGEVRPYGIARCIEQEPELEGWRWVIMGQCRWEFIGKTIGQHNKGVTQDVAVHFGGTRGSEPDTGLRQAVYNRYDDVGDDIWTKSYFEYQGAEFDTAEC